MVPGNISTHMRRINRVFEDPEPQIPLGSITSVTQLKTFFNYKSDIEFSKTRTSVPAAQRAPVDVCSIFGQHSQHPVIGFNTQLSNTTGQEYNRDNITPVTMPMATTPTHRSMARFINDHP